MTNTHTLLSVQEIEDLMLKAALHSWTPEQLARSIESKAIAAYAAKLAQGVELEVDGYCIRTPNGSRLVSPDEAKGRAKAYPFVPLSAARAAVAAERVKADALQAKLDAQHAWKPPLADFQEGQWWIKELDKEAAARSGEESFDFKRAVAVVHAMLRAAHATPSPLPAAAGVEERARLAGECKRLVDDLAEESAGYAAGEPNRETVLERRRVVHALLDRLASSAAQVPEGWQFDIIGGVARIKTPDGSLTAWAPRDSVDPADQTLYRLAAAMVDRAAAPAAGGEQS